MNLNYVFLLLVCALLDTFLAKNDFAFDVEQLTVGQKKNLERAQKIARSVNSVQSSWKAEINSFAIMDMDVKRQMQGVKVDDLQNDFLPKEVDPDAILNDPTVRNRTKRQLDPTCRDRDVFDLRKAYPGCKDIIGKVRNQGMCGSCWAVAAASSLTDRFCIAKSKKGIKSSPWDASNYLSETDILSCMVGTYSQNMGCRGGVLTDAMEWVRKSGVVTGTGYQSRGGCKPYPFAPPESMSYATSLSINAPPCVYQCQKGYKIQYQKDKRYVTNPQRLMGPGIEAKMMQEIRNHGTIAVALLVFEDFQQYKTGIYNYISGKKLGGHGVRLIGYGTSVCSDGSSMKYWIGANSWGENWGEKGFFRIARGTNEVTIESQSIDFATPKL